MNISSPRLTRKYHSSAQVRKLLCLERWTRGHRAKVHLGESLAAVLVLAAFEVYAAAPADRSLAELTLEELGNIEVTSVSKKAERLADAPASVFVISRDDIRRSGVTTLPDALRLAPNLHVAQVTASQYSISARGFNNAAANKLLVLIDGRSVYSPLFSGVFWDVQDVVLEDIERIEVISGPAGTLWGTNAVNGVINVITRSASATQGGLVTLGGGSTETGETVRYGGAIGEQGHYRIYGKYFDRNHTSTANGSAVNDAWHKSQAGFRADWDRAGRDQFTVQGDVYDGEERQAAPGTITITGINRPLNTISLSGVNLNTRWKHRFNGGSDLTVQAYYDRTQRNVPGTFKETMDLFDLQFQHALQPAAAHALVWGGEYRYGMDSVSHSDFIAFLPANVDHAWPSLFARDEIALSDDLHLTLGARIERNDYTGNEFLPNARLAWKFSPDHLLWTAASRTVRAPSRIDRDFFFPANPPFVVAGGPNFQSELADVYELGYRGQLTSRLAYSITVFHTVYDRLRTLEIAPSGTSVFFSNEMEGTTMGVEMWGSYQVLPAWRLSGGFTALRERLELKPGSAGLNGGVSAEGNDPAQTWIVRSTLDFSKDWEFDAIVRHVSALPNPVTPAYVAVDLRLGWKPRPDLELSITGRNLFNGSHAESGNPTARSEFGPSVYLKLLWRL